MVDCVGGNDCGDVMFELKTTCRGCGKTKPHEDDYRDREQWWVCSGYFKISGTFCSKCYNKISHRDGKPEQPAEYLMMLLKLGV
jgi:hypothetical protein